MHNHSHHSFNHHDEPHEDASRRIGWAFFLNVVFTIIEFIGGVLTNSTAIMADAIHDLGDCISIGMAWFLNEYSQKRATQSFTYGYRRFSLLGALINAFVLLVGSVWVLSEAIPRLSNPQMPMVEGMIGLAILGVIVNGLAAAKLSKGVSMNERVLNWHLLEDVLGWLAVLVVSIFLLFVDWPILDPLLSITFTLFILFNVAKNLLVTLKLFLQAVPDLEKQETIKNSLLEIPGVSDVHDLHFWSLDGEHHVLTVHLVIDKENDIDQVRQIKASVKEVLKSYNLEHTTVEIELEGEVCRDAGQKNSDL